MCDCLSTCDKIMLSIALGVVPRPCWSGQDSATEVIHLGLNQPPVFFFFFFFFFFFSSVTFPTWKLGHIPTCTLRGKDKVLMTTLLPNQLKIIYLNGRSTSGWTISPLISSHMKKDASGTRETDSYLLQ